MWWFKKKLKDTDLETAIKMGFITKEEMLRLKLGRIEFALDEYLKKNKPKNFLRQGKK